MSSWNSSQCQSATRNLAVRGTDDLPGLPDGTVAYGGVRAVDRQFGGVQPAGG
ncbi:hypothetical protein [Streptomyces hokutonensis]|uniref:hypothetical protein n=1 Tax=Streptomyces hokutonensis TaxID=1306990 RepID=UPI0003A64AF0|nr:hypothetical protein [Streptomyces hokutonensis]